ncbi:MAG: F0F1 ATP synthase subunit epsilon [Alphaproteobacteria bacterium]|nr:MAG: F0F1 ATP synthase subunit epsilon [Alphaproteobacteria bacterium]
MAETFQFDLVSPEKLLMSDPVEEVIVPGADGQFTVLIGHAPFLTTLKPGVLDIRNADGTSQRIYVNGGFADVNAGGLTVLAEQAMPLEEVNAEIMALQITDAEEDLADAGDDAEKRAVAQKQLDDLKDIQRWLLPG